jgi:hypothetical protein
MSVASSRDVLACTVKKAVVTRSSDPGIVLKNASYTGILSCDFGAVVRGAIIDRNDFKVGITLGKHRAQSQECIVRRPR